VAAPEKQLEHGGHAVALWAGVAAFFASLLAIGIFDILQPEQWVEYIGALLVAVITAGGVYARERLADAKAERKTA
jgi:hypothetical protein